MVRVLVGDANPHQPRPARQPAELSLNLTQGDSSIDEQGLFPGPEKIGVSAASAGQRLYPKRRPLRQVVCRLTPLYPDELLTPGVYQLMLIYSR